MRFAYIEKELVIRDFLRFSWPTCTDKPLEATLAGEEGELLIAAKSRQYLKRQVLPGIRWEYRY